MLRVRPYRSLSGVQIDFLMAEVQRLASLAKGDNRNLQNLGVKPASGLNICHSQNHVIKLIKNHVLWDSAIAISRIIR